MFIKKQKATDFKLKSIIPIS